ncbi:MAG: Lrp/AsnC family transcriptional regulator [Chloroflexi bacterium]|nr:Lrp/AsnC family transcriptional regulator [Chloroflexota bacterium]
MLTLEIEKLLDETGWRLLEALQEDARLSYRELGERVGLTSPAVTERIRKMEEAGIITGYHAEVNLKKLGLTVNAVIYLTDLGGQSCSWVAERVSKIPEVIECIRTTGSDSIILRVVTTSLDHLARVIDQVSAYGIPSTTIVRSSPFRRKVISRALHNNIEDES